jgi:hypothetical protein
MPKTVHVFTPVFHDVPSFLRLRENVRAALPAGFTPRFHLLDDTAGADHAVRGISFPDVTVETMPFNVGHQRALVYGIRRFIMAGIPASSVIVSMDADGEDRPEDLPALIQELVAHEDELPIVLARRTKRKESIFFKTFYFIYRHVYRALTGTVIRTGNYAVMHPQAIARIVMHPYFDLSYASTLFALGTNLRFVPCPRGVRYEGRSKMNFSRLAIHGVRMLMPFMDRIAIRGIVGFSFFFALSVLSFGALVAAHEIWSETVPTWVMMAAALSLVMSFLSICSFVILITVSANMQAMAMSRLETGNPGP